MRRELAYARNAGKRTRFFEVGDLAALQEKSLPTTGENANKFKALTETSIRRKINPNQFRFDFDAAEILARQLAEADQRE